MFILEKSNMIFVLSLSMILWCPVTSQPLTPLTDSVFTATQHCMVQEGIVHTSETFTLTGCASICNENPLCAAFGFQESDRICRLGDKVTDHVIYSGHCIVGESIYTSVDAQIMECDLDDGWYYNSIKNTCVRVFLSELNRIEAQSSCESHHSSLAVWNFAESKDAFRSLVESNIAGWRGNGGPLWTDALNINGTWLWSSGEEVADTDWAPGEPNGNHLCSQLYRVNSQPERSFMLDDKECNLLRQYVCEKGGY